MQARNLAAWLIAPQAASLSDTYWPAVWTGAGCSTNVASRNWISVSTRDPFSFLVATASLFLRIETICAVVVALVFPYFSVTCALSPEPVHVTL